MEPNLNGSRIISGSLVSDSEVSCGPQLASGIEDNLSELRGKWTKEWEELDVLELEFQGKYSKYHKKL